MHNSFPQNQVRQNFIRPAAAVPTRLAGPPAAAPRIFRGPSPPHL